MRRVVRHIGAAIVRGDHKPGAALPVEAEMCRALGVSRNALREAVKMLAGKGLLRTNGRGGTLVEPKRHWNLLDGDVLSWTVESDETRDGLLIELTRLRAIIEPEAAALAARHASVTDALRLFEAYEAMERHAAEPALAIEADIAFHEQLFAASGNQLLGSLARAVAALLRAVFQLTASSGGYLKALPDHRAVAEAIHRRDEEAARQAMRTLLASNERELSAILNRHGTVPITRPSP